MKAWREARGTEKQMLGQRAPECKNVCGWGRIQCMTHTSSLQSTPKVSFMSAATEAADYLPISHFLSQVMLVSLECRPDNWQHISGISLWPVPMIRKAASLQLHLEHGIDWFASFEHFSLCLAMLWIVVIGPRENRLKAAATASWMRIPRSIEACTAFKIYTKKAVRSVAAALISLWFFQ